VQECRQEEIIGLAQLLGKMRPDQRQTPSNTGYFIGEMNNYVFQQCAYINRD